VIVEANWYQDPDDQAMLRWWDGSAWTEHRQPHPGADQGGAPDATPVAEPQGAPGAIPSALPSSLANSTLFKDNTEVPTAGRLTRQNAAVVKVTLSGMPLMVARGAMIAYQGDVSFSYQGSGAKRMLKSMATGEGLKLMRCEGAGELFVSRGGHKLHLLELAAGEALSVSSRSLLGFDASVGWDIQMIKAGLGAMVAGGLFNVTITGPGTIILASDWPVVLNTSEARTCVDPNAVVAWSAHLQVAVRSSMSASALIGRGSGEAVQLEFSPGGYVIVEPEAMLGTSSA
jgi:uncharacterized protein (AIM24 family)